MPIVGWILVFAAAFSIVGVMFMVMREHHEPEEWYQPGQKAVTSPAVTPAAPIAPSAPVAPVIPVTPEKKEDAP
jgi:hypothetical protein